MCLGNEGLPAWAAIASTTASAPATRAAASATAWAAASSAIAHRRTSRRGACTGSRTFNAIKVRLPLGSATVVVEVAFAAFDHHTALGRRSIAAAHLGALLFQDSFAREANAIAFHCEHFHE